MANINSSAIPTKKHWHSKYVRYMFVFVSFVQAFGVVTIEAIFVYMILRLQKDENIGEIIKTAKTANEDAAQLSKAKLTMFVYLVIFMGSQAFQAVLSIQTVRFRSSYQVIGLLVFNFMTLAYSIFQYVQLDRTLRQFNDNTEVASPLPLLITLVAALISVCELTLIFLGAKLLKDFGWSIYRSIGCDIEMRKMLYAYQSFIVLIELEGFFVTGFMVQLLVFEAWKGANFYVNLFITPLIVLVPLLSVYGIRKEKKHMLGIALTGYITIAVYSLLKVVKFWRSEGYKHHQNFLTLFAILTVLFAAASFTLGIICLLQFGKGLGPRLNNLLSRRSSGRTRRELDLGCD